VYVAGGTLRTLTEEEIEKIRRHPNGPAWWVISDDYELSEDFIREFKDRVIWFLIFRYQRLSEEFLIEFIDEINVKTLVYNKKIPKDAKDRILAMKALMS